MAQGNGFAERVADPDDPLRRLLQAARAWQVPPTVFLGERKTATTYHHNAANIIVRAETDGWTLRDSEYAMALDDYEAQLDGSGHYLPETTKPEHDDAYRPGEHTRCHKCKAEALLAEAFEKQYPDDTAGVMAPVGLDPAVVERNLLPVPPLPPELAS